MTGNRLALDTNAYSDWQRGSKWDEAISRSHEVVLPFVVVAELRAGFAAGNLGRKNVDILERFIDEPEVGVTYPDATTLETYATLFANLKKRGKPIPTNDLWIAAICIQHNLRLATSDDHFLEIDALILSSVSG